MERLAVTNLHFADDINDLVEEQKLANFEECPNKISATNIMEIGNEETKLMTKILESLIWKIDIIVIVMEAEQMKKRKRSSQNENLSVANSDSVIQKKQKLPHSPISLLKQCIGFVAQNLLLVDSFWGLPDLIGKEIFKSAENYARFDGTSSTFHQEMTLFTEEYKNEVLYQLNVSGCHLGINYFLESLMMFKDLISVDLSACGLGDEHELLHHIASMNCLKQINLRDNALTDKGLQKMTTPLRVFRDSDPVLQNLDISENPGITEKVLKYLKCYKQLESVEVTGTLIERIMGGDWKMLESDIPSELSVVVTTEGWAATVVTGWMSLAQARSVTRSRQTTASKFYAGRIKQNIKSFDSQKNTEVNLVCTGKRTVLLRYQSGGGHTDGEEFTEVYPHKLQSPSMGLKTVSLIPKHNAKTCSSQLQTFKFIPDAKAGKKRTSDANKVDRKVKSAFCLSMKSITCADNDECRTGISGEMSDGELLRQYGADIVQNTKQSSLWDANKVDRKVKPAFCLSTKSITCADNGECRTGISGEMSDGELLRQYGADIVQNTKQSSLWGAMSSW
ncbi:hypothetical protein ScPMuIL_006934 [Solemya velum]